MNFTKSNNSNTTNNNNNVVKYRKVMKEGDLVIIYERHDSLDHLYLKQNMIFKNKFGNIYYYYLNFIETERNVSS